MSRKCQACIRMPPISESITVEEWDMQIIQEEFES